MKLLRLGAAVAALAAVTVEGAERETRIQRSEIHGGSSRRPDVCGADAPDPFGTQFALTVSFAGGYIAGFATERAGAPVGREHSGFVEAREGASARRLVADRERGLYAGYVLEIEPTAEGQKIAIAIKPLPDDYDLPSTRFCASCTSWTAVGAKLARYPEPFEIASGTTFLVDLLVNPATGEKLVDRVKVIRVPRPGAADGSPPPADSLKVKALFEWKGEGKARVLAARFCVRPLAADGTAGPLLASPGTDINPRADGSGEAEASINVVVQSAGGEKRVRLKIAVVIEPGGKTGVYTVDVREGEQLVHAEEVRFPLGS